LSSSSANLSIEEIITAYEDCRKNKRNNATTIDFECDFFKNIMRIYESVNDMTWQPSGHMCFVVRSPKVREVWASPFNDRVVHHIIYNRLRPRFEPHFIATSFACIPGRGTGGAVKWAEKAARKTTCGWSKKGFVLQADISNCFPTINTNDLCNLLLAKCPEPWLAHLVKEIILVDVKQNAHFPGDVNLLKLVPKNKSLWHTPIGIGLPIGNLTSQFGANVLLDQLDQQIVRRKKAQAYGRYVDDICVLDRSHSRLIETKGYIEGVLNAMGLELNDSKTTIKPIDDGFDFCGRFVKPHRSYLRRSTVRRGNKALASLSASSHPAETVTSYLGLARHCNAFNLRKKWASQAETFGVKIDPLLTKATRGT
jgi:hypothetical protein